MFIVTYRVERGFVCWPLLLVMAYYTTTTFQHHSSFSLSFPIFSDQNVHFNSCWSDPHSKCAVHNGAHCNY